VRYWKRNDGMRREISNHKMDRKVEHRGREIIFARCRDTVLDDRVVDLRSSIAGRSAAEITPQFGDIHIRCRRVQLTERDTPDLFGNSVNEFIAAANLSTGKECQHRYLPAKSSELDRVSPIA